MPSVRKKRPNAKLDNTRVRQRALEKLPGLAQSSKCAEMGQAVSKGKEKALPTVTVPDTDMIGSVEIVEEIPQRVSIPHGIGESSKPPPTSSIPSENAAPKAASKLTSQPKAATKADCPPELRPIVEAERRRAAETAANLALCSAAISGVEATLLPLTNGSNRQFVDSMRVYLRAAIAQYMATGQASTPPVLPPRPANPPPRAPEARSIQIPAVPVLPVKSTWATVARNGLQQKAVPTKKAVPRPAAKASKKEAPKAKVDKRLFLRLEKEHPWRQLTPAGLWQQLQSEPDCFLSDACSIHRVRTGFAILTGNEKKREELLDAAPKFSDFGAKLEEASNLVAFRIANVPATIKTPDCTHTVNADWVSLEIYRKTKTIPYKVLPHGTCRPGAPYRNWKALFDRNDAPRPGFRILDEAGMATIHKPRPQIEQCKRCLGFHATRGCSRAPACWNCGSNMHSEAECKALTKCRNCGGPHRSDSRACLARPSKSGPVPKEQLARIRQIQQGEFAKVARARAAAKKAEEAIIAAAKDVSMAEATGFGALGSEEEV
ncbi:putative effector protein [Blumeria hordei DH14]|uniref:Putative effector protein n=1 Tax=Blumeria graminis f. sp. hordei (strain DH14) TaxID=546991 RepID=N1J5V0_BLUG1|nr:putative effector protein [Blumeria hordei DH14]